MAWQLVMVDVHYTLVPCEFGNCVCGRQQGGCVHSRFQNLEMRICPKCTKTAHTKVRTWHTGDQCIRCMRRVGLVK